MDGPRLPEGLRRIPVAHRALHDRAHGRPENSLSAMRAAVAAGYAIEIDVQPSADGAAMVFHDYDLHRLTGEAGRIRGRDRAGLSRLRLLGTADGIPTLTEALDLIAGQVPLVIEIKDQDGDMGPDVGPLEKTVAGALQGYRGEVAVMSFNPESLASLARLAPDLPRGLITSRYDPEDWPLLSPAVRDRLRGIPDYDRLGAAFISHEAADLARPRVAELKRGGAAILCWTIRSRQAETEARRIADNVTFEGYPAVIPGQTLA